MFFEIFAIFESMVVNHYRHIEGIQNVHTIVRFCLEKVVKMVCCISVAEVWLQVLLLAVEKAFPGVLRYPSSLSSTVLFAVIPRTWFAFTLLCLWMCGMVFIAFTFL